MVEAAAEVDTHAVPKRQVGRENRSAGHQPKRLDQRPAIGHLKFEFLADRESSGFQLVDVQRSVHQKDVLIGGGLGLDEILRDGCSEFEQTVAYKPILLAWKDVMPEGEQISVAVNEPERQHRRQCPRTAKRLFSGKPAWKRNCWLRKWLIRVVGPRKCRPPGVSNVMKRASWIALLVGVIVLGAAIAGVAAYEHGRRAGMGMHMRFERMAVRLQLTPAQESQIKADFEAGANQRQARYRFDEEPARHAGKANLHRPAGPGGDSEECRPVEAAALGDDRPICQGRRANQWRAYAPGSVSRCRRS